MPPFRAWGVTGRRDDQTAVAVGRGQFPPRAHCDPEPDHEQGDSSLRCWERLEDALVAATQLNSHGIGGILDLLGEGVTDLTGAAAAVKEYTEAAEAIAAHRLDATISIKLSQLGQTVDRDACVVNLARILDRAQAVGVPVEIDMEDSSWSRTRSSSTGKP
jgi:Proline dehydrogenase